MNNRREKRVTVDGMVAEPDGGMNFAMKYLDEDMARWIVTHQNQWDTLLMAVQRRLDGVGL